MRQSCEDALEQSLSRLLQPLSCARTEPTGWHEWWQASQALHPFSGMR